MIDRALAILDHYRLLDEAQIRTANLTILCPLHQEKTPSCGIELEHEVFYCQGCGQGGSLIDLVAKLERVNTLEALRVIHRIEQGLEGSGIVGVKLVLPERGHDEGSSKDARRKARDFFLSLPKSPWRDIERHYLLDRGFTKETLELFDVRVNPSSEFPVIFPIREGGRFQGYMTRTTDNRPDKYRMSRGLRKSEVVDGTVRKGAALLLVEGKLDRMRAHQNGWPDTVSTLNWALSDVQLEKLSKAGAIICGLDNDDAGERGYRIVKDAFGRRMPVVRWPFPSWIKDHGELERYEFQAGLKLALRKLPNAAV